MSGETENPASNALRPGVTVVQVEEAIRKSDYPLQVIVASILRSWFFVEEEWGFREATTGAVRTLDLMAERPFHDSDPNRFRVRPTLNLLVECKQSDLPYVFFFSHPTSLRHYPRLAGLCNSNVTITTDDDGSKWTFPALNALGLDDDPFLHEAPTCATFSKCVRQGKEIELSGSEAYNALVMPLVAAATDFELRSAPPSTAHYFDARVVLAVAVLDAPMVGVSVGPDGGRAVSFVPWVRLVRNAPPSAHGFHAHSGEHAVLDIVHKDYFKMFLECHVEPFVTRFRDRAHKHHEELAEGRAFAGGMGHDSWDNVEARLQPSTFSVAPPLRVKRGWSRILQFVGLAARWALGAVLFRLKRRPRR